MEIHTLLLLFVASHGVAGKIWLSKKSSPVIDTVKFHEDLKITDGVALKIDISIPPGNRNGGNDESSTRIDENDIGKIYVSILTKTGDLETLTIDVHEKTISETWPLCFKPNWVSKQLNITSKTDIINYKNIKFNLINHDCANLNNEEMGSGVIAGIVIGVLLAFIFIIIICSIFIWRMSEKRKITPPDTDQVEFNGENVNFIPSKESSSLKKNPMGSYRFGRKKESPARPQNCLIDQVFCDNCVVNWREPNNDGGTKIKRYEVEAKDTKAGTEWLLLKEAKPTDRQIKIENLVNRHSYRFQIFAVNKIGKSPSCEMSGSDIYMMDPVDRQLCEKFSDEIISHENFQIAKHAFEMKQVDIWVEETIHKYIKGIKRENLDAVIDNICRSLNLSPELDKKLRSDLEQIKFTTTSGDFPHAIDFQHPEFKSIYGHLIAVEEEDKTITTAFGIHKLHFKLSDQESRLTPKEIEAIKNDLCKQNMEDALKSKGLPILRKKTFTQIDAVHMLPNLPS